MALRTDFKRGSRVGVLWQEMTSLAKEEGIPRSKFEKSVDSGYHTGFFPPDPKLTNRKNIIEQVEVLQYAYKGKQYYPLLANHGFPVPFAMNDFRGDGGTDDRIRKNIADETAKIQATLAARDDAPEPGSDRYKTMLALGLYEYLLPLFERGNNCDVEGADWEAIKGRCGLCTELSFATYYAFKEAGLDPQFMFLDEMRPTLGGLGTMVTEDGAIFHMLVGVPMSSDSLLQVDLLNYRFDAGYAYAKAGPAIFGALSYLTNLSGPGVSEETLKDVFYDASYMTHREWLFDYKRVSAQIKDLSPKEFKRELKKFRRWNVDRVTRGAMVAFLKNEYKMKHDFWSLPECPFTEEFFSAFRALDEVDSHLSALLRADIMKSSYRSLKKTVQEAGTLQDYLDAEAALKKYCGCFMDIIRPAVDMHPNNYASISTLSMIAETAIPFSQQADMYQELMEENPGHRVFMRMFALACLNTLVHEGMIHKTIDKRMALAYYARGASVMQELQELEPDDSALHYLFSQYTMWSGEYDLMGEYLDRTKSLRHEHARVDTDLEIYLLMNGIYRDDRALIKSQTPIVRGLVNEQSLGNYVEMLFLGMLAFHMTGRRTKSVEAQKKVFERFDGLLDDCWKDPIDMTHKERIAFKHSYESLNLVFEQLGDKARAKRAGERYEEVDIFF